MKSTLKKKRKLQSDTHKEAHGSASDPELFKEDIKVVLPPLHNSGLWISSALSDDIIIRRRGLFGFSKRVRDVYSVCMLTLRVSRLHQQGKVVQICFFTVW